MVRDLAQFHEPIGKLFANEMENEPTRRWELTPQQLAFYAEYGYLAGVPILNDAQVDALRAELESFFDPGHAGHELWYEYHANESQVPGTVLFHALGAWRIAPGFHDLLWHPALTVPASQMLDGAVRFWHDQLFCKPPRHGGVVAWHQDYSYWTRTRPMAHLTCWIGLDDSTVENGCLHYVPGSHRWELLPITGLAGDMKAIREVLNDAQWDALRHPVPAELKKGECTFHHPLTIHGSFENQSDRPRRAVVVNLIRDGVCSASDDPLLCGVPAIAKGEPLSGPFFPRLYDPSTA